MDRFQIAETENGPWLEFVVTNNPAQALAVGQARMDWPVIWGAKMRPVTGEDILPPQELLFGDFEERAAILYGSAFADDLHKVLNTLAWDRLASLLSGHLLDVEVDLMVPDIKRPYRRLQAVRPTDFIRDEEGNLPRLAKTKSKPSLKDLMSCQQA